MNRKIFKTGHSLAITLPQSYLSGLGLKLGDIVKIELDAMSECVVIRHGKKQSQLALQLPLRPMLGQRK